MTERKQLQVKKLCPFEEICDILKKNRDKKLFQCKFSAFPQFGLFWIFDKVESQIFLHAKQ